MKYYDYDKAAKLINENVENLTNASLGMHEDWFWTAQTVFENGVFNRELPTTQAAKERHAEYLTKRKNGMSLLSDESMAYEDIMIAGIFGSDWATPTLQLCFADGSDQMIPCFFIDGEDISFEEKVTKQSSFHAAALGCLSGPVQANITPLTT